MINPEGMNNQDVRPQGTPEQADVVKQLIETTGEAETSHVETELQDPELLTEVSAENALQAQQEKIEAVEAKQDGRQTKAANGWRKWVGVAVLAGTSLVAVGCGKGEEHPSHNNETKTEQRVDAKPKAEHRVETAPRSEKHIAAPHFEVKPRVEHMPRVEHNVDAKPKADAGVSKEILGDSKGFLKKNEVFLRGIFENISAGGIGKLANGDLVVHVGGGQYYELKSADLESLVNVAGACRDRLDKAKKGHDKNTAVELQKVTNTEIKDDVIKLGHQVSLDDLPANLKGFEKVREDVAKEMQGGNILHPEAATNPSVETPATQPEQKVEKDTTFLNSVFQKVSAGGIGKLANGDLVVHVGGGHYYELTGSDLDKLTDTANTYQKRLEETKSKLGEEFYQVDKDHVTMFIKAEVMKMGHQVLADQLPDNLKQYEKARTEVIKEIQSGAIGSAAGGDVLQPEKKN